jgi:hypothetical protein
MVTYKQVLIKTMNFHMFGFQLLMNIMKPIVDKNIPWRELSLRVSLNQITRSV